MATPTIVKKIVNGVEVDVKVYPMVDPRVAAEEQRMRAARKEIAEREAKEKK